MISLLFMPSPHLSFRSACHFAWFANIHAKKLPGTYLAHNFKEKNLKKHPSLLPGMMTDWVHYPESSMWHFESIELK